MNEIIRITAYMLQSFIIGILIMINQFLLIPAERRFFKWFGPTVFDPWWVKTKEKISIKTSAAIHTVARYATAWWL